MPAQRVQARAWGRFGARAQEAVHLAGAVEMADMIVEPDLLADACKQVRKAMQLSDRAAIYM